MRKYIDIINETESFRCVCYPFNEENGKQVAGEVFLIDAMSKDEAIKTGKEKAEQGGFTHVSITHGGFRIFSGSVGD